MGKNGQKWAKSLKVKAWSRGWVSSLNSVKLTQSICQSEHNIKTQHRKKTTPRTHMSKSVNEQKPVRLLFFMRLRLGSSEKLNEFERFVMSADWLGGGDFWIFEFFVVFFFITAPAQWSKQLQTRTHALCCKIYWIIVNWFRLLKIYEKFSVTTRLNLIWFWDGIPVQCDS